MPMDTHHAVRVLAVFFRGYVGVASRQVSALGFLFRVRPLRIFLNPCGVVVGRLVSPCTAQQAVLPMKTPYSLSLPRPLPPLQPHLCCRGRRMDACFRVSPPVLDDNLDLPRFFFTLSMPIRVPLMYRPCKA